MHLRALVPVLALSACLNVVGEGSMDSGGSGGGNSSGTGGGVAGVGGGSAATGGGTSATGGGTSGTGGGSVLADGGSCGCTTMGRCVPGDSPLACGNTSGVCSRCGTGEQCVNGQCVTAACGPGTCSGCCAMGFCITPSQQQNIGCGSNGAMCARCMMGQQCRNGACVTPVCDMVTCATGCCQGNQCRGGGQNNACGSGGNACMNCGMGGSCNGGMCNVVDAGPAAPIGSACNNTAPCGNGEFCLPDNGGFPGGYCSAQCSNSGTCPGSATCVTQTFFGFGQTACFAACGPNGGLCRGGYVCQPQSDGGSSYCRPNCNGGFATQCPSNQTCSADAGTCS